jgi:uncharacterized protein (UPF0332 family)
MAYFSPSGFWNVANNLIESKGGNPSDIPESRIRTSISRAYYAAFLKISEARDFNTRQPESHKKLNSELTTDYIDKPTEYKLVTDLDKIRQLRVRADYATKDRLTYDEAKEAVELSHNLLDNSGLLCIKEGIDE